MDGDLFTSTYLSDSLQVLTDESAAFAQAAKSIAGLKPRHLTQGAFSGKYVTVAGTRAMDLSGMDYLGLGSDPQFKSILRRSLEENDFAIPGSQAFIDLAQSRLLGAELARYHFGSGTAMTFTSGYATNISLLEALGRRSHSTFLRMYGLDGGATSSVPTLFFIDGALHFSARHGIRFAAKLHPEMCRVQSFPSRDYERLERCLRESYDTVGDALRIVVTDTIDSVTGQEFDVQALCALAERYGCLLYLDEAHAVGVVGPGGRGVAAKAPALPSCQERIILMGTLTKAFALPGGYAVVNSEELADYLGFCAPQHVFSAPIAPWLASAAIDIVKLVEGDFGEFRRRQLRALSASVRRQLLEFDFEILGDGESGILATPLRRTELGIQVLESLREEGFVLSMFGAPTVPVGREVLRISLRADVEPEEAERLVAALRRCRDRFDFARAPEATPIAVGSV